MTCQYSSMQDGRCIGSHANPFAVPENPGIHKALPPYVALPLLHTLGAEDSGRDRGITEYMHSHGFRRDLLFLRIVAGGLHASQELGLALDGTVVVDQHDFVVEDGVEGPGVARLVCLVPCLFQRDDPGPHRGLGVVLRLHEAGGGADNDQQAGANPHGAASSTWHLACSIWQRLNFSCREEPTCHWQSLWVGHSCPTLLTLYSGCAPITKTKVNGVGQECLIHTCLRLKLQTNSAASGSAADKLAGLRHDWAGKG